jgi:Ca-activated chloride channel family protein
VKRSSIVLSLWFTGFAAVAFAEGPATIVQKANRLYNKNNFDQALKLYNQAQGEAPETPEIEFDIGAAQYKKGDYPAAIASFEKACVTKDAQLEAKALYNIANCKYKMGLLKENTDLSATVALLRESLNYYKRSIELNPKDQDPKVNHELVERQLKLLLDKLRQEQEKQQKQEKGQGKEEKEQDKKQEGQQAGEQNKQGAQQERKDTSQQPPAGQEEERQPQQGQEKDEEKKGQPQGKQNGAEEQTKQPEGPSSAASSPKEPQKGEAQKKSASPSQQGGESAAQGQEMTEQEAQMLLDSYRQDEDNRGKLRDTGNRQLQGVDKDW